MEKRYYIAYGSNLDKGQMKFRCPDAKVVGTDTLEDYRLTFQGRLYGAHANVIPEKGCSVPVAIWTISARDEDSLDRYEGVKGGYYTKEYMTIKVNGKEVEALIYIMTPNDYGVPTDSYLETIAQGYKDFGLSIKPLNDALKHAYRHAKMQIAN